PLRPEALDLVALLLHLVILLQQLAAPRAGVLLLTHPDGLLLLRRPAGGLETLLESVRLRLRARQRCRGIGQLGDAAVEPRQRPRQLRQLRLVLPPGSV